MRGPVLAIALVISVLLLGGTSTYSSWVASTNHHNSCARVNLLADEFQNVIVLALTPAPGKTYTAQQVRAATAFEAKSAEILNKARC